MIGFAENAGEHPLIVSSLSHHLCSEKKRLLRGLVARGLPETQQRFTKSSSERPQALPGALRAHLESSAASRISEGYGFIFNPRPRRHGYSGVLRALASEVTEAEDIFPSLLLPLERTTAAAEDDELVFNSNWLGGLSRRSSAISVHSDEMSVAFPCSPAETTSGPREASEASQSPSQAEADFELQEEILHSVEHDEQLTAALEPDSSSDGGVPAPAEVAEDMISVVDIGDEVLPSQADAESFHAFPYMMSPRPLESTVASLLRRLSLEHQVDESVASSIRGVLEVSELLAAEMAASHLTQEEIEALPSFPYAPCKEQQHCAICLDAFEEREVVTMLRCHHFFHMECLASWMHRATKCPLCRAYCIE